MGRCASNKYRSEKVAATNNRNKRVTCNGQNFLFLVNCLYYQKSFRNSGSVVFCHFDVGDESDEVGLRRVPALEAANGDDVPSDASHLKDSSIWKELLIGRFSFIVRSKKKKYTTKINLLSYQNLALK
jgi:hypothetical protein